MSISEERFLEEIKIAFISNMKLILEEEIKAIVKAAHMEIEEKIKDYAAKVAIQMASQVCFDNMTHQVLIKIDFPRKL